MRTQPQLISVIVPTLQEEKYLSKTLPKLVRLKPLVEIIVVDGLSQDKTVDVAKRFTNRVFQIGKRGIARAKNYGAKRANGEILVFLDADVNVPENFVNEVLEVFSSPKVVGATCNVLFVQPKFREAVFSKFYNFLIQASFWFRPHCQGKFLAVRKNDFFKVGGFDESMPCLEDHDLAFRLSKQGKFVFVKGLTVYEFPRRFRKLGLLRVVGTWMTDYLSFQFSGKPKSRVWHPVR